MSAVLDGDRATVAEHQLKRLLVVGATVLVIALIAGFVFVSRVGREPASIAGVVSIPTSDWKPGDPVSLARTSGILAVTTAQCLYVADESGSALGGGIVWPAGYTARAVGGDIEVLNPAGEVVARTGAPIILGGGYGRSNEPAGCAGVDGKSHGAPFYVNTELPSIN